MRALLKSTVLSLAFSLLTLTNFTALAQQDEQSNNENTVSQMTSEPQNTPEKLTTNEVKDQTIPVPPPISLTLQHQEDIKHYLTPNKIKPLLAGTEEYITLVTENTSVNNKGVAILLPDWQQGATNPKAINYLRKQLPIHGWTTISIQPMSKPNNYPSNALKISEQQEENKAILNEYKNRLGMLMNAVIEKAKESPGMIMIIAQGNHGAMLVDLLNQENKSSIITQPPNALILISSYVLSSNIFLDDTNTVFAKQLANSEYPVLDLYLKYDNPIVISKAKQRLMLSKQEMKAYYRQRQLNNTIMGYYPEQALFTQIKSWLTAIGW